MLKFDICDVPFSRRGSWLSFSWLGRSFAGSIPEEGLYFRTVRDRGFDQQLFRVELPSDTESSKNFNICATPCLMRLSNSLGDVEVCMPDTHSVRFRGKGTSLRLVSLVSQEVSFALPSGQGSWIANFLGAGLRMLLTPLRGKLRVDAPWQPQGSMEMVFTMLSDDSGEFDLFIEEFVQYIEPRRSRLCFEEEIAVVEADFRAFQSNLPACPSSAAELAAYICWSSIVDPESSVTRATMLSSKGRMTGVWSWDHCFNALALSDGNPKLAWDQIMAIFDHQDEFGAIPDAVFNRRVVWNFTKPPVHGWAIARMLRGGSLDRAMKEEAYDRLERWTGFWFSCKDYDGDGIPQYDHGNDSGWDNASVFSARPPLEAPDLATYLVLQMDALALLAEELGRPEAERMWRGRSAAFLSLALEHLTRGDRMTYLVSGTHEEVPNQSLLPYLQLLLGERLPGSSLRSLVNSLKKGGFITTRGISSESTLSPRYTSDGYWLGPIWAPSTLLMIDALMAAHEPGMARDIAQNFLALAENSGFPENYDALTGAPLRDKAFTWTASVYLILCRESH